MRFLVALTLFSVLLMKSKGYPYAWKTEEKNSLLNEDVQENSGNSGSGDEHDKGSHSSRLERKRSVKDEDDEEQEEQEKKHDGSGLQQDLKESHTKIKGPITVTPFKAKTKIAEGIPKFAKHPRAHPFHYPFIPVPVKKGVRRGPHGSFVYSSPYGLLKITPFRMNRNRNIRKRCMCAFPSGCPEEFQMSGFPCGMGNCGGFGGMCGMGGGCNGCNGGFGGGFGCGGGCPGCCCGGFRPVPMPMHMVMGGSKSDDNDEKDDSSSKNKNQPEGTKTNSSAPHTDGAPTNATTSSKSGKLDEKSPALGQNAGADQTAKGKKIADPQGKKIGQPATDAPIKPVLAQTPGA